MMPQVDLHRQEIPLPLLRILHDPGADILVAERLVFPYRLPMLIKVSSGTVLHERLSNLIDLRSVVICGILRHSSICPVAVAAATRATVAVLPFVIIVDASLVVRVKEGIVVVFGTLAHVAIIVIPQLIISIALILVIIFCCLPLV